MTFKLHFLRSRALLGAVFVAVSCSISTATLCAKTSSDAEDLARYRQAQSIAQRDLKTFDTLDFDIYSNQKWERLAESHRPDIKVHWPDGHVTVGLERHIEDLKFMFTFMPDLRIVDHPVRIGDGEWTSVIGVMEGHFTRPMKMPDGTMIQPTGNKLRQQMVTVGHWKDGLMDEEYLFWDNATFMQMLTKKTSAP